MCACVKLPLQSPRVEITMQVMNRLCVSISQYQVTEIEAGGLCRNTSLKRVGRGAKMQYAMRIPNLMHLAMQAQRETDDTCSAMVHMLKLIPNRDP